MGVAWRPRGRTRPDAERRRTGVPGPPTVPVAIHRRSGVCALVRATSHVAPAFQVWPAIAGRGHEHGVRTWCMTGARDDVITSLLSGPPTLASASIDLYVVE